MAIRRRTTQWNATGNNIAGAEGFDAQLSTKPKLCEYIASANGCRTDACGGGKSARPNRGRLLAVSKMTGAKRDIEMTAIYQMHADMEQNLAAFASFSNAWTAGTAAVRP